MNSIADSTEDIPVGTMQAIHEFVNANSWAASRQVVEAKREVLLTDEVDKYSTKISIKCGRQARRAIGILKMHRDLLERCREIGIEAAFAKLEAKLRPQ